MEWVLWIGVAFTWALAVVILHWRAVDTADRETDAEVPADHDETLPPVRPSEIRVMGSEFGATTSPGQCHDCGTDNDPCYTYCRECLTALS